MNTIPLSDIVAMPPNSSVSGLKASVKTIYPSKNGKNGPFQGMVITQDGVDLKVMLWSHDMVGQLSAGQAIIMLSGGDGTLKVGSYNGTPQLAVNKEASVSIDSNAAPASAQSTSSGGAGNAKGGGGGGGGSGEGKNLVQLTELFAIAASTMRQKAIDQGLSEKVSDQMALHVNAWIPTWWFGEKTIALPQPPLYARLAMLSGVAPQQANNYIKNYCGGEYGDENMSHEDLTQDDVQSILSKASVNALKSSCAQANKQPAEEDAGLEDGFQ